MHAVSTPLPVVILISGGGTNLQAIIDAQQSGALAVDIRAIISNRPDALGLKRAQHAGIPNIVMDHKTFASREAFDRALISKIDSCGAPLVVLAGFMRILTAEFVQHFAGRILNIHPSLLPKHRGLDTHAQALAAHDTEHGASVHFVTTELDGGPVIAQARVPVLAADTAASLQARVREVEHILYPRVLQWYASGRISLKAGRIVFDGKPLDAALRIDT